MREGLGEERAYIGGAEHPLALGAELDRDTGEVGFRC